MFSQLPSPPLAGALSATFVIPVAITSLPTVASDLSWYSWYFWQQLGWVTLLFAVLHVQFFVSRDEGRVVWWPFLQYPVP